MDVWWYEPGWEEIRDWRRGLVSCRVAGGGGGGGGRRRRRRRRRRPRRRRRDRRRPQSCAVSAGSRAPAAPLVPNSAKIQCIWSS